MTFTLGFSPCPNDTFIFDALVNKKIDTEGFDFEPALNDVQTLNELALQSGLDITKISYGVLPLVDENYHLLNAGGALGKGVGPLLIAKKEIPLNGITSATIAIPGKNTTANLLFSLAFPQSTKKQYMLFSMIEEAVLNGSVDAGVIIHENRFTYRQKGLVKLIDLGEYWESETRSPIPLGGIVIRKSFEPVIGQKVDRLIRRGIEYAFGNYPMIPEYVKKHSQEMDEHVMRQHIDLYVNNYSLDLGEDGKLAVSHLLEIYHKLEQEKTPLEDGRPVL